ncbi:hypothetical protein DXB23_04310 [Dorea sp. OM02-2LB]|nr:hypothetical protein DXB23_04310 [Dorea sp. OM02-2LB]
MVKKRVFDWKILYILTVFSLVLGFIASGINKSSISEIFLLIALLMSFVGYIIILKFQKISFQNLLQLEVTYLVLFIFFSCALMSPLSNKDHFRVIFFECLFLSIPTFGLGLHLSQKICKQKIYSKLYKYRFILIICALFFLLSIETLDDWVKLDSGTYYTYVDQATAFDFTFDTFELFKLGGHRSYGASILYLIGAYIFPQNPMGVRIIQIICFCITLLAFSSIVHELSLDHNSSIQNALLCAIPACSPLILGTIYSINIDFMMMCFWIWTLHSLMKKNWIFFFLSSFFLIFSKEVGIVIYGGIILSWGLWKLFYRNTGILKFFIKNLKMFVFFATPGVIFIISWVFGGSVWFASKGSISISSKGDSFHKFGISLISIISKLKQLYLLNFAWILLLIILVGVFSFIIARKSIYKKMTLKQQMNFSIILGSYVMFIIFNFLYITYGLPRYVMPHIFIYVLLVAYALNHITISSKIGINILLICINGLLLAQSFFTIDPITLHIFRNVNIGKRTMISTIDYTMYNQKISSDPQILSERVFSHCMEYNREYTYFGDAFEKVLKEINYSDDTLLLVESIYENESIDFSSIVMFGKENGNDAKYYYDSKKKKIVYDYNKDTLNLKFINQDSNIDELLNGYKDVYVISFPYNKKYIEFSPINDITKFEEFSIFYRGWEIDVRKIR